MIHFTLKLPTKISAPEVDSYYHKEYGIVDQDNRTATDPLTWHDVWNTDEWSERDYHFTMRVIDVNAYRTMQSVHSFDKTLQFFYGELSDVLFDNPWWKAEEESLTTRARPEKDVPTCKLGRMPKGKQLRCSMCAGRTRAGTA